MRRLTGSRFALFSCQQLESGTALGVHALDPRSETRKKEKIKKDGEEASKGGREGGKERR